MQLNVRCLDSRQVWTNRPEIETQLYLGHDTRQFVSFEKLHHADSVELMDTIEYAHRL